MRSVRGLASLLTGLALCFSPTAVGSGDEAEVSLYASEALIKRALEKSLSVYGRGETPDLKYAAGFESKELQLIVEVPDLWNVMKGPLELTDFEPAGPNGEPLPVIQFPALVGPPVPVRNIGEDLQVTAKHGSVLIDVVPSDVRVKIGSLPIHFGDYAIELGEEYGQTRIKDVELSVEGIEFCSVRGIQGTVQAVPAAESRTLKLDRLSASVRADGNRFQLCKDGVPLEDQCSNIKVSGIEVAISGVKWTSEAQSKLTAYVCERILRRKNFLLESALPMVNQSLVDLEAEALAQINPILKRYGPEEILKELGLQISRLYTLDQGGLGLELGRNPSSACSVGAHAPRKDLDVTVSDAFVSSLLKRLQGQKIALPGANGVEVEVASPPKVIFRTGEAQIEFEGVVHSPELAKTLGPDFGKPTGKFVARVSPVLNMQTKKIDLTLRDVDSAHVEIPFLGRGSEAGEKLEADLKRTERGFELSLPNQTFTTAANYSIQRVSNDGTLEKLIGSASNGAASFEKIDVIWDGGKIRPDLRVVKEGTARKVVDSTGRTWATLDASGRLSRVGSGAAMPGLLARPVFQVKFKESTGADRSVILTRAPHLSLSGNQLKVSLEAELRAADTPELSALSWINEPRTTQSGKSEEASVDHIRVAGEARARVAFDEETQVLRVIPVQVDRLIPMGLDPTRLGGVAKIEKWLYGGIHAQNAVSEQFDEALPRQLTSTLRGLPADTIALDLKDPKIAALVSSLGAQSASALGTTQRVKNVEILNGRKPENQKVLITIERSTNPELQRPIASFDLSEFLDQKLGGIPFQVQPELLEVEDGKIRFGASVK